MTGFREIVTALMSANYPKEWPKLVHKHETKFVELSDGETTTWNISADQGEILIVYATTCSPPRKSSDDSRVYYTSSGTAAGFKHWHEPFLIESYNYLTESEERFVFESYIEVEHKKPYKFSFFNNTGNKVFFTVTVWYLIVKEADVYAVRQFIQKQFKDQYNPRELRRKST